MRILVLTQYYPPEMGGASARLHGLARWLVQAGHRVTVITGFPNYPAGIVPSEYRGRLLARETADGVSLVRTWLFASPRHGAWRRLANYITFMCSSIVAGLFAGRGHDVVLASSPPLFVGAAGWLVAQLLRIPFVFDVRDIWPDVAVDAGEFAANAPVVRFLSELADSIYAQADCIIPVTETKQTRIRAHGVPDSKMRIVPNGVDLDLIPDCPGDVRPELDLIGRFVVLYAGLIGVAQGLEIVTEAAELLRDTDEVRFLIVGDGVRRPALEDEIHRRRLRNVVLLPSQQREAMPAILNTGDVCLVPLSSAGIADAVPSKLLEAWAYRRPVILAAAGESADIVRKVGGGVVIGPRDAQALAQTILLLKESPEVLAKQGAAGRLWVENSLDRRKLADLLASVLEDVVENSGRKGRRRQ